ISFSLNCIKSSKAHARCEIPGVLVHEVIHSYWYNTKETCPGGLMKGIADFVRFHTCFALPHWRPRAEEK
ncbi:hypothetical protein BDR03DRAFT_861530, partial [Suillus americanus]